MKRALVLFVVFLMLSTAILPDPASARGNGHGGHRGGHGGWWWPGAIIGGLALSAVAVATAPIWALGAVVAPVGAEPPVVYAQPAYAGPAYSAPPAYSPPPPQSQRYATAPAVQREVVYPNGKYVLYGDGVQQPWQWVWVPAASPPPPPPPPPR